MRKIDSWHREMYKPLWARLTNNVTATSNVTLKPQTSKTLHSQLNN